MVIESLGSLQNSYNMGVLLAQLAQPGINTPEDAALIFSGPQFFIALLSGLILTFGFQLLLTNLSVAAGISYISHSGSDDHSGSGGINPRKIGTTFGLWTVVTVSLAMFCACLLAVKLSLYDSALLGGITGLVIWGTYFCLLFWVSSTTVGSLIGSVVKTATSSFQSLVGTATSALGAKVASNQLVHTVEAAAAAIRKEVTSSLDSEDLKESLREYVGTLRSPELDIEGLEGEFERLLQESGAISTADQNLLSQIDRQAFVDLLTSRTDLSRREVNRAADRLYRRWQHTLSQNNQGDAMTTLVDYLKSANPQELLSKQLSQRLDQFLKASENQNQSQKTSPLAQNATQVFNALIGLVMGRADLADMDVNNILKKLREVQSQISSQGSELIKSVNPSFEPNSVIKADVENYLLNAYVWQLTSERLQSEFYNVLYDPQADSRVLKRALQSLNRSYFADLLGSRGLLLQDEIYQTSLRLETVRQQVLAAVTEDYRLESLKTLQGKVDAFLQFTSREDLLSEIGKDKFRVLLIDDEADATDLDDRFSTFGDAYFYQRLQNRNTFTEDEVQQTVRQLTSVMESVRADAHGLQASVKVRADQQWQQLQDYLRNTGKTELNPEGIKADIRRLMEEPDVGAYRLRQRLAQFDRETLVQLLSQREEFSEAEVRQTIDDIESTWYQVVHAPATLTAQAQAKYDQATDAIATYLRETGKPELNPDGIKHDIQLLLNDPKAGFDAMQLRLSQMDRDTLVQLLSQRDDLSEEEVNRIIDSFLENIQSVLRLPQRLVRRAKVQAIGFKDAFEEYLRNTDKAELNPEGIKRDLQLLLNDPRLGSEQLQERLAHIDRDTVVALLSQRHDIAREDAEAAVDQVLAVREQIMSQVRQVQVRLQSMVDSLFDRIRQYLESLNRPELDYYGIRNDLRKLFDDPQAGFDALKQRLSDFDRDTLVALISSHDAVSEADVNRVIDQVEAARDSALQKAERLEHRVQRQVNELKLQAQQQVEETRKTAEAASWWLLGTATFSAIAAVVAGALAVSS